jgi:hypothetical protein
MEWRVEGTCRGGSGKQTNIYLGSRGPPSGWSRRPAAPATSTGSSAHKTVSVSVQRATFLPCITQETCVIEGSLKGQSSDFFLPLVRPYLPTVSNLDTCSQSQSSEIKTESLLRNSLFLYLKNLSSPKVYNTFQTDIPLKPPGFSPKEVQ